jgi:hypothetical protein
MTYWAIRAMSLVRMAYNIKLPKVVTRSKAMAAKRRASKRRVALAGAGQ